MKGDWLLVILQIYERIMMTALSDPKQIIRNFVSNL